MKTLAATTLIIEISWRAARLPSVSIFQAACSTISRAPSISMRELGDEVLDELLLGERPAEGLAIHGARGTSARARARPPPIARMQWWMRPGPSRSWAITKPAPRSPSRLAAGTRQSS